MGTSHMTAKKRSLDTLIPVKRSFYAPRYLPVISTPNNGVEPNVAKEPSGYSSSVLISTHIYIIPEEPKKAHYVYLRV